MPPLAIGARVPVLILAWDDKVYRREETEGDAPVGVKRVLPAWSGDLRAANEAEGGKGNSGRIVAIDIETGQFEVADDPLAASDQLFAR